MEGAPHFSYPSTSALGKRAAMEIGAKSFVFIPNSLRNGPIFILGGAPKAHEVLAEK
jgi:hypothetical protein